MDTCNRVSGIISAGVVVFLYLATGSGQAAEPAGKPGTMLHTKYFSTMLPSTWEVVADDVESMGMLTLAQQHTAGTQSVSFEIEGGGHWEGNPEEEIAKVAGSSEGTPPEMVTINSITYVQTSYTAHGTRQTMMITGQNGYKISVTILGDGYAESLGVKLILDSIELKLESE